VSDEPSTDVLSTFLATDPEVIVSFITPLEVTSAFWRKAGVNADLRERSQRRYDALERHWMIVGEPQVVLEAAMRMVSRYRLRTGDAIQLAAAILAAADRSAFPFVTLDGDLRDAARAEGFPVLP